MNLYVCIIQFQRLSSFYYSINVTTQCSPPALLLLLSFYRFGGGKFNTLKCTSLSCKNLKNGSARGSHTPMIIIESFPTKFLYPLSVSLLALLAIFLKNFTLDEFYSRASHT